MINVLIIDDEKDARFLLRNRLEKNFNKTIKILGEADDVDSGEVAIKEHKPDVVFLDIQMPQGTGFDLLNRFDEINFEVIFVTAFNDYAVKAFEFSAFGYLMKPVKSTDLKAVIDKVTKHFDQLKKGADKRLKVLVENFGDDETIKKLVVANMEGFQVVELSQICHLKGDRNYTHFITVSKQKITTSKTLGEYEILLADFGFFRIHQSTLVNLRHVKGFLKEDGGLVEMKDGTTLKLSRHRKPEFIKRFV